MDLAIEAGERVALLGPNGAGKTTFVLTLNGLLVPQAGEVRVGGVRVEKATLQDVRRRVGIVFQDPDDQVFMPTVWEDVAFGPANFGVRGGDLDGRVAGALGAVGMDGTGDRPPHHLSQGERRRVALATVLVSDPDVLVLDEPSANLDPAGRRELAGILEALSTTLLVVTHDLPYALMLCPRAVIMSGGRVVADGPTADVLGDGALLAEHRLEFPFGFDSALLAAGGVKRRGTPGRGP